MTISATLYSNVSLSKVERVFTALKNEADPYAAAEQNRSSLLSFLNEGTKKFGYDRYKGQDEFVAALVDAWRQLAHQNRGEITFQIEDSFGIQRTVALQKNQGEGIDLVEKNANSGIAQNLLLGDSHYYAGSAIDLDRVIKSPSTDNVIAKVPANKVAVVTTEINTAIMIVKSQFQFQLTGQEYNALLALTSNKKFQLTIAHEVLADANKNGPDIVEGALKHIIANGDQSDIIKAVDVLKGMIANPDRYQKEVIQRCALVVINERIDDDLVQSMVEHVAPEDLAKVKAHDPNIVVVVLKHIIANDVKDDIQKAIDALKKMVADGSYKKEVTQLLALFLITNCSINDDLVKSVVSHIVANADRYDKEIIQSCALFIVRQDKYNPFRRDIALAAVDILASDPKHLRGLTLVSMARTVIYHNHNFFSESTNGQKGQEKIIAFYKSKGRMDALLEYNKGFDEIFKAHKEKISVIQGRPGSKLGAGQHFVKGNVKDKEVLKKLSEGALRPFYTENKNGQFDQILGLYTLWIQEGNRGNFDAPLLADRKFALEVVNLRNHAAIKIWNTWHDV